MESKWGVPTPESPVLAELSVAKSATKEREAETSAFKPTAILRVGRMEVALSGLIRWLNEAIVQRIWRVQSNAAGEFV